MSYVIAAPAPARPGVGAHARALLGSITNIVVAGLDIVVSVANAIGEEWLYYATFAVS